MLSHLWLFLKHVAKSDERHKRELYASLLFLVLGLATLVLGGSSFLGNNETWYLVTIAAAMIPVLWFAAVLYVVVRDTNFRDRFDDDGNYH